jgi:replicative DNA helicase
MQTVDSKQFAQDFIELQKKRHEHPELYHGFSTGLDIDRFTGGIQQGWQVYIYGKPKAGKTAFLSTFATKLGKDGVPFLWIGLEETLNRTAGRIFANIANVGKDKFRDIKVEEADWGELYTAAERIASYKNTYWNYGAYTIEEINTLCNELPIEVLFIDYIQLMIGTAQNKTQEVSTFSKYLRRLANGDAIGRPITVIAAAQLNDDGQPLWSRDLNRDTDLCITVKGIDDGFGGFLPNKRTLDITNARDADVGAVEVGFIGKRSMLVNLERPRTTGGEQ